MPIFNNTFSTGNKLICDCRLSWIQILRNETKSEPLRLALNDVTCSPSPERTENTSNEVISENPKIIKPVKTGAYEIEANSEVITNNDEDDDASSQYKMEPTVQPVLANQIAIVDMPIEAMPCPSELVQKGEDSLMLSSKDESYWQPSSSYKITTTFSLTLTLVLIVI